VSHATGDPRYLGWALELARAAHAAFVYTRADDGRQLMHWKMSIDLRRVLVPSMGHHDPLDGFLVYSELRAGLPPSAPASDRAFLDGAIADMRAMAELGDWTTDDALGIGGLLTGAHALMQLPGHARAEDPGFCLQLLHCACRGLRGFLQRSPFALPPSHRLGFRELGLAIGLRAVPGLHGLWQAGSRPVDREVRGRLDELKGQVLLADRIEACWLAPAARTAPSWTSHLDINEVMLATSMAPEGYLSVAATAR
jgi:hypothetical protein